jgi:hypothetical protein
MAVAIFEVNQFSPNFLNRRKSSKYAAPRLIRSSPSRSFAA